MRFENLLPEYDEMCQEAFPKEEKLTWHECGLVLARTIERNDEPCVSLRRVILKLSGQEKIARGSATVIPMRELAPLITWLCNELSQEAACVSANDRQELLSSFQNLLVSLEKQDEVTKMFENL